jgi:hypothetical protein
MVEHAGDAPRAVIAGAIHCRPIAASARLDQGFPDRSRSAK